MIATSSEQRGAWCGALRVALVLLASAAPLGAAERLLGDLDNDGVITVLDLRHQIALARGQGTAAEQEKIYADVNRDGVFNDYDSEAIVRRILGTEETASVLPASVLETSPRNGEGGVSLTREFVVRFTMPLALDAALTTHNPELGEGGNLFAEFGGRKLLTRVELSSDRRKATLFFLEPLPASARVRVVFAPLGVKDLLGKEIDADGDGEPGGVGIYDFDTLGLTALAGVGVTGKVYGVEAGTASATPRPLAGVTISVDGAEETLRTVTGPDGSFVLTPAPAGRFFVTIDGRTATNAPGGGYYTFVGKAWEGVPGRLDTPATPATATTAAGEIFLPFIPSGTLQAVSSTEDTTVRFPASVLAANPVLEGVQITVPANSLFADSGARGGQVGIAPVAPDKLPEPLPPGLNPALVITIQTDGATNFDRPVPVRFPNTPDRVTGRVLLPGEKSALWSFDHDIGEWTVGGAMTVTADGKFVETDPGVGVRQPGWHLQEPGNSLDLKTKTPDLPPCDYAKLGLAAGGAGFGIAAITVGGPILAGVSTAFGAASLGYDLYKRDLGPSAATSIAGEGSQMWAGATEVRVSGIGRDRVLNGTFFYFTGKNGKDRLKTFRELNPSKVSNFAKRLAKGFGAVGVLFDLNEIKNQLRNCFGGGSASSQKPGRKALAESDAGQLAIKTISEASAAAASAWLELFSDETLLHLPTDRGLVFRAEDDVLEIFEVTGEPFKDPQSGQPFRRPLESVLRSELLSKTPGRDRTLDEFSARMRTLSRATDPKGPVLGDVMEEAEAVARQIANAVRDLPGRSEPIYYVISDPYTAEVLLRGYSAQGDVSSVIPSGQAVLVQTYAPASGAIGYQLIESP